MHPHEHELIFSPRLRQRIAEHLAGIEPVLLPDEDRRRAAVCVTLIEGQDRHACFLLQRRASRLRGHSGQWALPGGRVDKGESPLEGALRELSEEVHLHCGPADVLGRLDDYPTRSGYVISPFVVWVAHRAGMKANPREVAELHEVPLSELERADSPQFTRIKESERPVIRVPVWDRFIHAPTAAYLYQFREAGLHGRHTPVIEMEQPVFAWR